MNRQEILNEKQKYKKTKKRRKYRYCKSHKTGQGDSKMKVKFEEEPVLCSLSEIEVGKTFWYKGQLYRKVQFADYIQIEHTLLSMYFPSGQIPVECIASAEIIMIGRFCMVHSELREIEMRLVEEPVKGSE